MLKHSHRLKSQAEFQYVFSQGKRKKLEEVLIISAPNRLAINRFGVIVSKKVSKKAVVRNKIRRVVAELLRPHQLPKGKEGSDVLLLIQKLPVIDGYYRYFSPIIRQWFE